MVDVFQKVSAQEVAHLGFWLRSWGKLKRIEREGAMICCSYDVSPLIRTPLRVPLTREFPICVDCTGQ
ncbi:hypothetical protein BK659_04055 [Pseudomonas brassicacearum]|uniref:Uncharacterized protein n=1 Tax=Pseudomonas brassicacearum TaxID=930166 RepID=A0A423HBT2_9PSED|nr:hypothetical protein BK659_04055 [Pseudomonas brassicacearum]